MRKVAVLVLGLIAVIFFAPNDGQSQAQEGEQHGKKEKHQSPFLPTSSVDSMELFDRITGGKPYMTADDIAGLETLKAEMRSAMGGNGGNGGNAGPASQITREQFYTMVEQLKVRQRLQREQLLKQIEWQRQRLLAGDDPNHIQPMPGDTSQPAGDQSHQDPQQKAAQDQHKHQRQQEELMQQLQQQQQAQGLNAELEAAFRSHKLNKDGYLTKENSSPLLRAQWDIWDFDGNDLIDMEEYKAYKMAERVGWKPVEGQPNPFRPSWAVDPPTPVYRKGKLPPGLPQWFIDLSAGNEEAQIYLFDWRQAGRSDEEFFAMDRNEDGILTADEVLSYLHKESEIKLGDLVPLPDPGNLLNYAGQTDKKLAFTVTGQAGGGIWGSGTYTLDSPLAVAAVHAGKIKAGETGVVVVEVVPNPGQYAGTTQNGVTSQPFGDFPQGAYRISKVSDKDKGDKGKKGSGRKREIPVPVPK